MEKLSNYDDELFCKEVTKTKDVGIAFQNLHPEITNHKSALAIARNKISNSSEIRHRISELLDIQHLSLIDANKKLKRLLNAKKPIVIRDQIEYVEDNTNQLIALDKLYKLHGLLQNSTVNVDSKTINIGAIGPEQQERMTQILSEMSNLAAKLDLTKNRIEYVQQIDT